jgi:hypothetical protein
MGNPISHGSILVRPVSTHSRGTAVDEGLMGPRSMACVIPHGISFATGPTRSGLPRGFLGASEGGAAGPLLVTVGADDRVRRACAEDRAPRRSSPSPLTGATCTPSGPTVVESLNIVPVNPPFTTTTTITSTTPDLSIGQPISVTVSVKPVPPASGVPTGQVTVSDGSQKSTPCTLDGSGDATCSITESSAGPFTFNASYMGDSTFNPSSTTSGTSVTVFKDMPSTQPSRTCLSLLTWEVISPRKSVQRGAGRPRSYRRAIRSAPSCQASSAT